MSELVIPSMKELRKQASELKIPYYTKFTKNELLEKIAELRADEITTPVEAMEPALNEFHRGRNIFNAILLLLALAIGVGLVWYMYEPAPWYQKLLSYLPF